MDDVESNVRAAYRWILGRETDHPVRTSLDSATLGITSELRGRWETALCWHACAWRTAQQQITPADASIEGFTGVVFLLHEKLDTTMASIF